MQYRISNSESPDPYIHMWGLQIYMEPV
jgi:hypothetical protein